MPDTKLGVRKATAQLREDHEKVMKLFLEYEDLGDGKSGEKDRIFKEVERELGVHATLEEEIFYPAVQPVKKGKTTDGDEIVKEALEEHKIVKTLLAQMAAMEADGETFDAKMKVLTENVRHHAGEEQEEMFPLFEKLPKEEQARVSQELADRKSQLQWESE